MNANERWLMVEGYRQVVAVGTGKLYAYRLRCLCWPNW